MSTLDSVYGLMGKSVDATMAAVDNMFNRQLYQLGLMSSKHLKPVTYIPKDAFSNRGEVAQRGVAASSKSVVDMGKLTPLTQLTNARTFPEEVALNRASTLGFLATDPVFHIRNEKVLMLDYLLASSLCYVEVYNSPSSVDKFFATRNRNIANSLCDLADGDMDKYGSYLGMYKSHYDQGQLKVLKLAPTTKGDAQYRVQMPRSPIDFSKNARVTPVYLLDVYIDAVTKALTDNIIKFTYLKDNLVERELITSLSIPVLSSLYPTSMVEKMITNTSSKYDRGYVKLPELGLSKHDKTGVRSLNIGRVTSVTQLTLADIDRSFIDVDFDGILPYFRDHLDRCNEPETLYYIHQALLGQPPSTGSNRSEVQSAIHNHVDIQYKLGTTTFLRQMHKYLVNNKNIYADYNDGLIREHGYSGGNSSMPFELGGSSSNDGGNRWG